MKAYKNPSFPDAGAQEIWNFAQGSIWGTTPLGRGTTYHFNSPIAATYVCINFMKIIHSVASKPVTLHIMVDDVCDVIVNGFVLQNIQNVYLEGDKPRSVSFTLKPGDNIIKLQATILAGPAGLLATIIADATGEVLAHTDTSWYWSTTCT